MKKDERYLIQPTLRQLMLVPMAAIAFNLQAHPLYTANPMEHPLSTSATAQANQLVVKGKVIDHDTDRPISDVKILVRGTSAGTMTGPDGRFTIMAAEGSLIEFSHEGKRTATIEVDRHNPKDLLVCLKSGSEIVYQEPIDNTTHEVPSTSPYDDNNYGGEIFMVASRMPEYPGGMGECLKFISKNVRVPKTLQRTERIIVQFVVRRDGSCTDFKVKDAYYHKRTPELEAEAIRVLKLMPKWEPGYQNGDPVNVRYTVPVTFRPE